MPKSQSNNNNNQQAQIKVADASEKSYIIMIVDDEKDILDSISRLLSDEYHVITAFSGAEGLKIIKNMENPENLALVISDYRMNGLNGIEFLEKVKQKIPRTIRILLTGYADKEVLADAINRVKIYEYIDKPFQEEELLNRVKNAVEFFSLQRQLEKSNREKDILFRIIAHDLNNAMTSLSGNSTFLSTRYKELTEAKRKKHIDIIEKSQKRVCDLLKNLLDWGRAIRGELDYKPNEIDIYALSNEIIDFLKPDADEKNIHLHNEVLPHTAAIADKNLISTALRNLLSNSIKFTHPDGWVKITARIIDDSVEVSVIDNGIGMDEKTLADLFQIKDRFSQNGTAGEKGCGIGLLNCYELIKINKGKLTATSSGPEKGSCFTFTLPRKV